MSGGLGDTVVLQRRLVQLHPKAGRLWHHGVATLDLQGLDDEIVLAQEVADDVAGERAAACRRAGVDVRGVAEAQIDAGVRRGVPAAQGAELVVQTLAGTAELLRRRDNDTMAVRREVSSPGGLTARGVDALERGGVRAAFSAALDAVLQDGRG